MSEHASRLAALRGILREAGAAGFWMNRTDEHGSEYLPDSAERVAWLTGFTGSAGQIAVLPDRAALLVDGRYTVQAEREVDHALWERLNIPATSAGAWLAEHAPGGAVIAYDPMLARRGEIERLEKALKPRSGRLVPVTPNPIDRLWHDRPALPSAPAVELDPRFTGEDRDARLGRIGEKVAKAGADQLLLTSCDSIAWLLNLRGGDIPYNPLVLSFALVGADGGCRLFVEPAKVEGLALGNRVSVEPYDAVLEALDELGRRQVAVLVDPATTALGYLRRLETAGARVVEADDPTIQAKAIKNPVEIAGAVAAQIRDGAAMTRFLAWLDRSLAAGLPVDELSAAERIDAERAKDPLARGPSFPSISAHGPNAAFPHYRSTRASNRPLTAGTFYLIDSGGQYLDGTTDVTRTIAVGEPTAAMRDRFTRVLKGMIAVTTAVFPQGTTGAQLDTLARTALWQAGLDFDHGTGHGVGAYLCVHEGPARIAKTGHGVALEPGMILSDEPGYYRPDAYGVRIENLVVVEPAPPPEGAEKPLLRFRNLTWVPIDRRAIEPALLTPSERAWLDDYHRQVREQIGPLLEGADRDWLIEATRPL